MGNPPKETWAETQKGQEVCTGHMGIVFEEEETVWPKALSGNLKTPSVWLALTVQGGKWVHSEASQETQEWSQIIEGSTVYIVAF